MAVYSFWVYAESNISLTGGVTLDGITQGDGSHLVGQFLTINDTTATEIVVDDSGAETNFADNDGGQRLDGDQTIDGVTYSDGTRIEAEYQFVLVDDATGIEYTAIAVNINNSSPSYGTIEALTFVSQTPPAGVALRIDRASEGPSNGGPSAIDESLLVPIYFCRGTLIETAAGLVPIERLAAGDAVARPDGTHMPLRRVLCTRLSAADLAADSKLRPVRITAGSLGYGTPARDLLVSRQHRILVSSVIAQRMFGQGEVLVPAVKLTALPGVFVDEAIDGVEYFHMLFDAHEIVVAEGAAAESLLIGPEALKSLTEDARQEILALFPEAAARDYVPKSARFIPPGGRQRRLIERHRRNRKPLQP